MLLPIVTSLNVCFYFGLGCSISCFVIKISSWIDDFQQYTKLANTLAIESYYYLLHVAFSSIRTPLELQEQAVSVGAGFRVSIGTR